MCVSDKSGRMEKFFPLAHAFGILRLKKKIMATFRENLQKMNWKAVCVCVCV